MRRSQYVPNEISHFYNETDSSEYIESIYSIDKYTYYFMKSPSISRPLFLTPTPAPIGITHATDFVKIVPTKHQLYEIHMLTFKNVLTFSSFLLYLCSMYLVVPLVDIRISSCNPIFHLKAHKNELLK